MDYVEELKLAEKHVADAEREFLKGTDGIYEALLEKISTGSFASDAELARKKIQELDESRFIKWDRWDRKYTFSATMWKDTGYPTIDTTTFDPSNPDWYSERTGTSSFVKEMMTHRTIIAPTTNGERDGPSTPKGKPANKWLLDFVVLSSLRLSLKQHWERLVHDILVTRPVTHLDRVAERLGLTTQDVLDIARKIRDLDDRVIEYDVSDPSVNLTYHRRKPDPDIVPLVDLDE